MQHGFTSIGQVAEDSSDLVRVRAMAAGIRRRVLAHVLQNNGGYLSQACSAADILAVLYGSVMQLGPSVAPMMPDPFTGVPGCTNPDYRSGAAYNGRQSADTDRFFFSPAHYALVLYAALIEAGRMAPEGLSQFNQDGSTVEMIGAEHSPGVEVTTGSLAQGLSQAAGVALSRRLRGDSGACWAFLSDGEFQEGQTWETFAVLAHYRLDTVRVYVDVNGQQCDGRTDDVLALGDLAMKLRSFGAEVIDIDGHDVAALVQAGRHRIAGRPLVVLARTSPVHGLERLRDRAPKFHYFRFRDEAEKAEYEQILQQMSATASLSGG